MIQRLVIALASLALMTGAAFAQAAPQEQIAARLIAQAGVSDVFSVAADDPNIARHRASGLACDFSAIAGTGHLLIFPGGLPRGEDVGCDIPIEDGAQTFYATRYRDGHSAEEDLQGAVWAISMRFPDARDFRPDAEISLEGAPQTQAAAFIITDGPLLRLTSVHIVVIDSWFYKMRFSKTIASENEAGAAYLQAQLAWNAFLTRLIAARSL